MNGNITREGITADLEAMARVGIGGVLIFEVTQGEPAGPVKMLSPQWRDLVRFMPTEAQRLGIEVNMNSGPGWAGSGGPWITPGLAMQKLTVSETTSRGPQRFDAPLPQPPTVKDFYRDLAVLAFPTPPADDKKMADCSPKASVSVSGERINPQNLIDGNSKTEVTLPQPNPKQPPWMQVAFPQPFTARTVTFNFRGSPRMPIHGTLLISDDGRQFKTVREFDCAPPTTVLSIPETTSRCFRVQFTRVSNPKVQKLGDLRACA